MIQKIHIQNFRSLEDVRLDLEDVNLLIGPNNVGKSNLLKAFEFLKTVLSYEQLSKEDFERLYFKTDKQSEMSKIAPAPIAITIENKNITYRIEIYDYKNKEPNGIAFIGIKKKRIEVFPEDMYLVHIHKLKDYFEEYILVNNGVRILTTASLNSESDWMKNSKFAAAYEKGELIHKGVWDFDTITRVIFPRVNGHFNLFYEDFAHLVNQLNVYSINVSSLKQPYPTLENDYAVNANASNLVAFLDNMRDAYPKVIENINEHLKQCIEEFRTIIFEKVNLSKEHNLRKIYGDKTFKRIGILDKYNQRYWADELSDGVLYFLSLLAIIHQPNPPKLLLLEEPENGIHPRRIKEIVDFIFDLSARKKVQVIMTTHSTVLIDEFRDFPENIFVFDKSAESTVIKNLQHDIIAKDRRQSKELNLPEIDLSGSLGNHWASGLIGGVPR
ncbi:MAG: ATP-binding protein [Bacteroidota bacterium]